MAFYTHPSRPAGDFWNFCPRTHIAKNGMNEKSGGNGFIFLGGSPAIFHQIASYIYPPSSASKTMKRNAQEIGLLHTLLKRRKARE